MVSKIFRYCISALGILAAMFGAVYFWLYYHNTQFKSSYGDMDVAVVVVTVIFVFLTEIANGAYVIEKDSVRKEKPHIKPNYKRAISLLVFLALAVFVVGGDMFYLQIGLICIDIVFFLVGNMLEYNLVEVETHFE